MRKVLVAVAMIASTVMAGAPVWAECCKHGDQCPMSRDKDKRDGHDSKGDCPITSAVIDKAKFYLEHADEIGLSEQQVGAIKAIKVNAKKTAIRQGAEMQVFEIDIKSALMDPALDVDALNAMFDTASQGFATGAKQMVGEYVKLKAVLSEPQQKTAKEIWKKQ